MELLLLVAVVLIVSYFVDRKQRFTRGAAALRSSDRAELDELSRAIGGPLFLRRITPADAEFAAAQLADPVAILANGWDVPVSPPSIEEVRKAFAIDRWDMLIGVERASNEPVGWATFEQAPLGPDGSISIGLTLAAAYRGKGYARQLMGAAISLNRGRQSAHGSSVEIYVGTSIDNPAIQRIMDQLGYTPEPDTQPYQAPNGTVFESYWYRCGPGTAAPRFVDTD